MLDVGGAKRRGHSDVNGMWTTLSNGYEDVAWPGVVVRIERAHLSLREEAGVSCLVKNGVAQSIMMAITFVFCCTYDAVITKGVHGLITSWSSKFGRGVYW